MAIITLGELLHRKGGGAISAESPLQVRQFDGTGSAISPATETTLAALKTEVDKLAALIDSDALKVALTGSLVETPGVGQRQVVVSRAVYTSSQIVHVPPPAGARGLWATARVYAATGSFDEGQGLNLTVIIPCPVGSASTPGNRAFSKGTSRITSSGSLNFVLYPTELAVADLNAHGSNHETVFGKMFITNQAVRFALDIIGTFGDGEGFDAELVVYWVF